MASSSDFGAVDSWTHLETHDWNGPDVIETTLSNALQRLDDPEPVLYRHVDLEAVVNAFGSARTDRGVSEIRFEYKGYEVRIASDGTISAR